MSAAIRQIVCVRSTRYTCIFHPHVCQRLCLSGSICVCELAWDLSGVAHHRPPECWRMSCNWLRAKNHRTIGLWHTNCVGVFFSPLISIKEQACFNYSFSSSKQMASLYCTRLNQRAILISKNKPYKKGTHNVKAWKWTLTVTVLPHQPFRVECQVPEQYFVTVSSCLGQKHFDDGVCVCVCTHVIIKYAF